jgi:hypothetical protein
MITGPFRGSDALRSGLLSPGALRGPRFRRLFPDVYVPAALDVTFAVRSRAAFLLVERRGGMLAGYSAAAVHGASCEPTGAPAEVLVAVHMKPRPDLLVHQGVASETAPAAC